MTSPTPRDEKQLLTAQDMTDERKSYKVDDRRRVDDRGQRRTPVSIPGKREIPFQSIRGPLDSAFQYFRAQVEHLPGRGWPKSGDINDLMRGFIISTHQLYAATVGLMADRRPKQLVMPAGVVARALVEVLGNLMAILDAPDTAPVLYLKDDYRSTVRKARYFETRYQRKPSAKDSRMLDRYGRELKLTAEQIADPERRLQEWPTPGRLLKKGWLKGERRDVFAEIYGYWYGSLSGMAHQRLTALQVGVFTEDQPDEQTFLMAKTVTAMLAVSVALSVLSEIEEFLKLQPNHHLRVAWTQVVDTHDLIQRIHRIRYGHLLERPTPAHAVQPQLSTSEEEADG